ncbi:MAG: phosphodiester glycosidase family protein, partial [Clostridia bacterium]|nr:phosphodiester glycosidase family protein [Clostridia bacterium]
MKKIAIVLALILTICTTAYAAPLYKYEDVTPISDSITLTKVREFYSDYNISYSYIKADLTNENTSLKLLKSDKGTDILDTVGNLAMTEENTVAAMNADFFSVHSGNKGFSLGIEIKDGALIQSPINPSTMATISYIDNKVDMSYLDFQIMAVAPNGQSHEIRHLNKHTTYYGHILMYTKDFNGGMSPAPGGNVVEVVVQDNKIVEFRRNMPPVQIPENGCVLVASEGVTMFLANNFNVGDEIKFDYYITPAIYNVETAFGGGAMLVSNGQAVTDYSHVVAGNHPRSAIGVDKSGSTLYLVTVDGRQDSSLGMRMSTLANLMISLGCYNAVNLDGGGSTNMVASTTWDSNLHTVNSPTENRKVINAVGLTYTSDATEPAGILLKNENDVTFIGQPVNISAVVHDKNLRPVSGGEIAWSSQYGTAANGVFTPSVGGNTVVNAACGNAVGSTEIYVVDTVTGIDVDSHIQLNPGETSSLNISAFDADGHYVSITNTAPFEISSSNPAVVSVSGKTLTAHADGTAIISVKKDGA